MTKFYLPACNYGKWENQNQAIEIDYVEGTLLDSFVVGTKRGYAFLYEHFRNTWTSDYLVVFVPYKDENAVSAAWEEWTEYKNAAAVNE